MKKKQKGQKGKAKVARKPRPKQAQLPGTETVKDKALVKLAEKYAEARDARLEAGRDEIKAKSVLVAAMKLKEITRYEDAEDDMLITLIPGKDKLKVKALSDADEDDEEEVDEEEEGDDDVEVDRKAAGAGEHTGNGASPE
jgi:hypothetical protein